MSSPHAGWANEPTLRFVVDHLDSFIEFLTPDITNGDHLAETLKEYATALIAPITGMYDGQPIEAPARYTLADLNQIDWREIGENFYHYYLEDMA